MIDNVIAAMFKQGINRYYGFNRDASILIVGHSRAVHGIDAYMLESLTNKTVAKYAIQGTTPVDHFMMFKHYVSEHPKSVKIAVYVVDDYLFGKGFGTNQYRQFYPFMDNAIVDSYINTYASSLEDYWMHKYLKLYRYSEGNIQGIARMGFLRKTEHPLNANINIEQIKKKIASINLGDQKKIIPNNVEQFVNIISYLRSNNIHVLLFYMPFIDLMTEDNSDTKIKTIGIIRELERGDPGITFVDDCAKYSRRYDLFIDATHPNRIGQKIYTKAIAETILSEIK